MRVTIMVLMTSRFWILQFTGRRCQDDDKLLKVLMDFDRDGDEMIQPQVHAVFKLFPWIRHFPGYYGTLYRNVIRGRTELQSLVQEMKVRGWEDSHVPGTWRFIDKM